MESHLLPDDLSQPLKDCKVFKVFMVERSPANVALNGSRFYSPCISVLHTFFDGCFRLFLGTLVMFGEEKHL